MIRIFFVLGYVLVSVAGLSSYAYAQSAESQVRRAIEDYQNGKCSDVLSITVKYQCEQTKNQFYQSVKALGPLISLEYLGIEQLPAGQAEAYLASHENGEMLWLANLGPDGKLNAFWSPGPS